MPEPQGTVGVLDSLEDVVLLCDMEGRVMQANRAASRRLGWSLDELRSMSLHALVAPAAVEGIPRLMEALRVKGKALFETEMQTRGGGRMAVEASVTVVEEGVQPPAEHVVLDVRVTELRGARRDPSPAVVGAITGVAVGALSAMAGNRDAAFDGFFWVQRETPGKAARILRKK